MSQFVAGVAAGFLATILAWLFMRRFRIKAVQRVLRDWLSDLGRDVATIQQRTSDRRTVMQELAVGDDYVEKCLSKNITPGIRWRGHVPDVEQYVFAHADLVGAELVTRFVRLTAVVQRLRQTSEEVLHWQHTTPTSTRVLRQTQALLLDLDIIETRVQELALMTRDWPSGPEDAPRFGESLSVEGLAEKRA